MDANRARHTDLHGNHNDHTDRGGINDPDHERFDRLSSQECEGNLPHTNVFPHICVRVQLSFDSDLRDEYRQYSEHFPINFDLWSDDPHDLAAAHSGIHERRCCTCTIQ